MNFNEISGKNVTYDIKKGKKQSSASLQAACFLKHILGLRRRIFLNETSILVFAVLAVFHFFK